MGHIVLSIDCAEITDRESFHDVFARELGFPEFYGRNMDAWIDCMTSVDEAGSGMTAVLVGGGSVLVLDLKSMREFKDRLPDLAKDLEECTAFVNWRRLERGLEPVLALSYSA